MDESSCSISAEGRVRNMAEHDGCKLCKYENYSMESKECIGCKQNSVDKYKRMTQGDRIRSMSDEELADFIEMKQFFALANNGTDGEEHTLKWLQSEVEE